MGRLIFIWPLDSWWGCWPQHGCLEPPNFLDLEDTDEEVDAVLQSLLNPQSDEGKGNGVGLPKTLVAPSLDLGLSVVPGLIHDALTWGQAWAAPIIQQLWGGLLVVETSLDYES